MNLAMKQDRLPPVNLAWTGGWDSTFRLLQLLLIEKRHAQPHYIIRAESSTGQEIDAMNRIRRELFRRFPEARHLLMPTCFVDVRWLDYPDEMISECERIRRSGKLNEQYPLLAWYCKKSGITDIEVCINRNEVVALKAIDSSDLFEALRSPLVQFDKQETRDVSYGSGWQSIMQYTVFCRNPKKGAPCGLCGPCFDAVTMGFGGRLPPFRRMIAYVQVPFRRWYRRNRNTMSPKSKKAILRIMKGRF